VLGKPKAFAYLYLDISCFWHGDVGSLVKTHFVSGAQLTILAAHTLESNRRFAAKLS
jgi:hypothetical protein